MRVLVTGAGGMVGRQTVLHCESQGDHVDAFDRAGLDISDGEAVDDAINRLRPDVVINCAAATDVDGCELNPGMAYSANADGPENLALACRSANAGLVTISTDYVFRGDRDGFYTQRDHPDAINVYGKSKIEGERRAIAASARTVIVRSGWIFGPGGRNFLSRVIELSSGNQRLKAICNAFGTPTYAPDLAAQLRRLAKADLPGVYHVVNQGEGTTFEGFVREALSAASLEFRNVDVVTMESLSRPAPRPVNSRLRCLFSDLIGLPAMPHWTDSLKRFAETTRSNGKSAG